MKKITLFLLLMPVAVFGSGQNVDSLYHQYREVSKNKRIAVANEIAAAVHALECTDTLFHLENNAKPELVDAVVNELMSSYATYELNDDAKAIAFSLDAAKLYEAAGDFRAMDLNYSNAGNYYFRMGNYEKAIELMLKCYELEKQMNDTYALSSTLNSLGVAYSNWGNHETAMEYFRQAIEIERPHNRAMQYAGRLSSLAKENAFLGNYGEALRLIKEALVYDEKIERKERYERIAVHQKIMGDIYVEIDSLPQAEKCYRHAVAVFETNNRQRQLSEALLSLGRLQLRQYHVTEAIETLKNCVAISEKNSLLPIWRDACFSLHEAYHQTGSAVQALSYLKKYVELNNSIFKETTQKQLSEFQIKYETAEKELEISRQKLEINRQKDRLYISAGGLFVAGLLVVLLIYIVTLHTRRNLALSERNEALLQRNSTLSEMNTTKDKFFSIISHDLKNPAIAQRDALHQLVKNGLLWNADTLSDYYAGLLKSAEEEVELIYSLLDWARLQTGRMTYTPDTFSLSDLLPDISIIRQMAENKDITINVTIPCDALVTGDSNMLAIIVRNLLTNAVKFTASGGTVSLSVTATVAGKYCIAVSDTGVGMSREQLQNLFRLDSAQSRKGTSGEQGSGLGLIVCKELLEKHGSALNVESEEGKGSRFWFEVRG